MGAARMLTQWTATVQTAFTGWHGHQIKAFAAMSLGMCLSRCCQFSRIALVLPTVAKAASVERRCERLVSNVRVDAWAGARQLAAHMLCHWSGRRLQLLLDETPMRGNRLYCLKVSVGYRRRALPLVWVCYRRGAMPTSQPRLVKRLLAEVADVLPASVDVTLMADRGLSWPLLIDLCDTHGWHFVLRLQGQTHVELDDGRRLALCELVARPAMQWTGPARVFKTAGWRKVNVVAVWRVGDHEPWLLATDLPATRSRCQQYRKRMWQEQAFRDEKSHGFQWQRSGVTDPVHAERLLLIVALATWLAIALGSDLIKRGRRYVVQRSRHRALSVFQLGLRWLQHQLARGHAPPCRLKLHPYDPKLETVGA